jgi:hypothetical protein
MKLEPLSRSIAGARKARCAPKEGLVIAMDGDLGHLSNLRLGGS